MRVFARSFTILAVAWSIPAQAQTAPKRWDASGSAALIEVRTGDNPTRSGDDWYAEGRYAAAIGHYWTEHLKTEVEYATSGEGSTYQFVYPATVESLNRLEQLSARIVWQFGENRWVHPYVSGGLVGERDRHRLRLPEQYQYPPGRSSGPMAFVPGSTSDASFDYRLGFTAGAGAKFYVSPNAFLSAGIIGTYAKPAATISLLAGFGIDF